LAGWSRTQAVPADCLCLRKANGQWPLANAGPVRNAVLRAFACNCIETLEQPLERADCLLKRA